MANLTLSIDDRVLHEARKLALDRHTSVNQLVREYLETLTSQSNSRRAAHAELERLMAPENRLAMGPITWTRDDLYKRR